MSIGKTIRQAVFNNEFVAQITDKLDNFYEDILTAKETIVDLEVKLKYDTTVKDAKQAVIDLEVEVAYEVLNDLDKDGKKKFTNEAKRKDETRRRLLNVQECKISFVKLNNEVADALRAESVMKMDLGQAHARLAAIEAENHNLRAIAGMIAGLAHESTTQERIYRHVHVTKFETTVKIGEAE